MKIGAKFRPRYAFRGAMNSKDVLDLPRKARMKRTDSFVQLYRLKSRNKWCGDFLAHFCD
jgi:hypothetical protein